MSKVPPEIARKIAAMKQAAPGARPAGAAAAPKVPAPKAPPASSGGGATRIVGALAAVGWLAAAGAGYLWSEAAGKAEAAKQAALAEQKAAYDSRIAQLQAEAAAQLKKAQDDAAATQMVMQTELEFAKLAEIPLETSFRGNQVLFVSNASKDEFTCKVRLYRPVGGVTREFDFKMRGGGYQDLAAIEDWLFAKGDQVEFIKSGYKPRKLVVP